MQISLLEDDPAQAAMVRGWLEEAGHEVRHYERGQDLVAAIPAGHFDLLILDWELPDVSGVEVLNLAREQVHWHVPILFITQRDAESDIVQALQAGADDYMVKNISRGEFMARVTALGRRLANEALEFSAGPYRFSPDTKTITRDNETVELTAKDFELAQHLFRNVGRLLSREQLLRDVWNVEGINTRTVDVHMSRIRRRMQINPESGYRIKTIYQHGYRLEKL
jgi:DNA-binding response OmpR family regulator